MKDSESKKIIRTRYIVILTIAVLILPLITSSQTIEELQAQIADLMKKVQELQAQLQATQGGSEQKWCHTFNVNLRVGNKGQEVGALEQALTLEGFNVEHSSNFAPEFNERVASAVTAFQEKYKAEILTPLGLKSGTGFVGPSTRKKLNQLYGCGIIQPSTTPYPTPYPTIYPTIYQTPYPTPTSTPIPTPYPTIFPTPSSSVLHLTNPIGNQTWQRGAEYNVMWTGGGGDINTKISILLQPLSWPGIYPLIVNTKDDKSEAVYIPSNIPFGKYSLRIYCIGCNGPSPLDAPQNVIDINSSFTGVIPAPTLSPVTGDVCQILAKSGDPNDKLNVIFIPTHYYKDMELFRDDATGLMQELLSTPFYEERKNLINFFYVAKTSASDGCGVSGSLPGNVTPFCDRSGVENLASNCPYNKSNNDQIVAVFDRTRIITTVATAQKGLIFIGAAGLVPVGSKIFGVMPHEFSHSFGNLPDITDGTLESYSNPETPICASNSPGYTCQDKWGDLIGVGEGNNKVGCYQGCIFKNWYRPTLGGDMMRNANDYHFDPVSLRHMDGLFKQYK